MPVYIAFLRGINVGGKNILPMKELALILEQAGAKQVRTYIQSGNAVFTHEEVDRARFGAEVSARILRRKGIEARVMVLSAELLTAAMAGNPFPEAELVPKTLHLAFFGESPTSADLPGLTALCLPNERFFLGDGVFYVHAPDGIGKSKLVERSERYLGVPITYRNWRTVCAMRDLLG